MPISTPSYFPPNRANDVVIGLNAGQRYIGARTFLAGLNAGANATITDLIVIGDNAATAGMTDASGNGTVVIGSKSATDFKVTNAFAVLGPLIAIGGLSAPTANAPLANSILIGIGILPAYVSPASPETASENIFIGHNILQNLGFVGGNALTDNLIIGCNAVLTQAGIGQTFNFNVIIGQKAAQTLASDNSSSCTNNTAIGYKAMSGCGGVGGASFNVAIGDNTLPNGALANRCIAIGSGAGAGAVNPNGLFWIEEVSSTLYGIFYGDMKIGSLLLGNSTGNHPAREFGGAGSTNILKILDGTPGATAPVSGGYLYGSAGQLHWVDEGNVDHGLTSGGAIYIGTGVGLITPPQLAAVVNDYAPAGFAAAQVVRLTPAAGGSTINGLAGGTAGLEVTLRNLSTVDSLTFTNLNAGSLATNQFETPGGANLVIVAQSSVTLWYDGTSGNWSVKSWA